MTALTGKIHFVLYVSDQQKSTDFYSAVLNAKPTLNVPGMTEFQLTVDTKLGLMPEKGIVNILKGFVPDPASGSGIPRCELYLIVDDPAACLSRAITAGATKIDDEKSRDWGDNVAYCADVDGHILAFACPSA